MCITWSLMSLCTVTGMQATLGVVQTSPNSGESWIKELLE